MGKKQKALALSAFILLAFVLVLSGCTQPPADKNNGGIILDTNKDANGNSFNNLNQFVKAKDGDAVSVFYTLRGADGKIIETNVGGDALIFTIGSGGMIKGFNDAIVGMKVNDTKTVNLPPELAYGTKEQGQKGYVDANFFPNFADVNVGSVFELMDGRLAEILEKNDSNALILAYPKLAGQTLTFEIILVSIQ